MKILLLLLALMGAFAAGPETKKKTATAVAAIPDAELEKDIRARLARSKLASNNLQVTVRGGVATIEGQVKVVQHKGVATRMAKNAGAKQVVNRIKIDEAARQKAASQLRNGRPVTVKRAP